MWRLLICCLTVLLLSTVAEAGYTSLKCTSASSYEDCINSVNNAWTDISKCIPILPSSEVGNGFLGNSTATCASWKSVQSKNYTINLSLNNALVPPSLQAQTSDLRYNIKWAYYAYEAKPTDTLLEDMKIVDNAKLNTRVVMGYDADRNFIVTSFRGSNNTMNWVSDAEFPKKEYLREGCVNCSVHEGFFNAYNSLAESVKNYLPVLYWRYPDAKVVFTGHSLGAVQAVLGAIDTQLAGYTVHLHTYGSPRLGDQNFAAYFNSVVTATNMRAVFVNDPVPNIPPMSFNFMQGGTEVHFCSCSTFLVYPPFADARQVANPMNFNDHRMYPCISEFRY
jgi:hypothetical protein